MKNYLVLMVILSLGLAGYAHAAKVTHQLANPEETIMLRDRYDDKHPRHEITEFQRSHWDGSIETDNYRIPEGKALVITDVDFEVAQYVGGDRDPGDLGKAWLAIVNLSSKDQLGVNVAGLPFRYGDYFLSGGKSHSMSTGIIVRHGSKIIARTESEKEGFLFMYLRGYLVNVPNPKGR